MNLIASTDKNWLIGNNGKLPWRIPTELKFFKETTLGSTIIMGRKTWDSLPQKPLPRRYNVVISRRPTEIYADHMFCSSLTEAVNLLQEEYPKKWIIGGAEIYKSAFEQDLVSEMLISVVEGNYEGDTYFPKFDLSKWNKSSYLKCQEFEVFRYTKV